MTKGDGERRMDEPQGSGSQPQQHQWASLYEQYYEPMGRYFLKHTKRRQDAEDLVQDVFADMMAYRSSPQNVRVYMWTMARNQLCKYWRHRRSLLAGRRGTAACSAARVADLMAYDVEPSPLEQLSLRETNARVDELITCLSPGLSEVLQLRLIDVPQREAMSRAGCSQYAWNKRLARAKQAFRRLATGMHVCEGDNPVLARMPTDPVVHRA
jgi:RNA polymerase sigma factor (sigma-70 family)